MSEYQNDESRSSGGGSGSVAHITARFTCRYDEATNRVIVEDGGSEVAVFRRGNTEMAEEYAAWLEASRFAHDGYGAIARNIIYKRKNA